MKMRLFSVLLLSAFAAYGQTQLKPPSGLKPYTIYLNNTLAPKLRSTTAPISVLDARADSSKIGFMAKGGGLFFKIVPDRSFPQFFNEHSQSIAARTADSEYTLLFVLRKLWLDETTLAAQEKAKLAFRKAEINQPFGRCHARIEVYAKKDEVYVPLFRLDSVFEAAKPLKVSATDLLCLPIEYCLDRLRSEPLSQLWSKRKKMTLPEVEAFSFKNKVQPGGLMANMQKGIFHTYADFLNNMPDTSSFSIRSGNLTDELVLQNGDKHEVLNQFWGYSDGKTVFIRLGLSLFPLYPVQNTFELWGFPNVTQHYYHASPVFRGTGPAGIAFTLLPYAFNTKKITAGLKPLMLDMDTGTIF